MGLCDNCKLLFCNLCDNNSISQGEYQQVTNWHNLPAEVVIPFTIAWQVWICSKCSDILVNDLIGEEEIKYEDNIEVKEGAWRLSIKVGSLFLTC